MRNQNFPFSQGQKASQPAASEKAKTLIAENKDALKLEPHERGGYPLFLLIESFKNKNPKYADQLRKLKKAVEAKGKHAGTMTRVMIMDELKEPRPTFVLNKGIYDSPTEEQVTRDVPSFLPPLSENAPSNRLGLARWLFQKDHPLTARVTVNRFWQSFFGRGLVKTTDDFGVQGELPTHPELLDWLAATFMDTGWDIKALHKLIVMSATYQQSSKSNPQLEELDPENKWLARGARYRLPSWMIRDQALHVSGLLIDSIGGKPVKPYQPSGIWEEATFGKIKYKQGSGDDLYRRTLYTFWRRIVGPTMLFDNSARQVCAVKASLTNTPLHALTTLNDITYVEAARVFAQRLLNYSDELDTQLIAGFRLATSRSPKPKELKILKNRFQTLKSTYQKDNEAVAKLLTVGEAKVDVELDSVALAAMTGVASLILNLDEVITKQ